MRVAFAGVRFSGRQWRPKMAGDLNFLLRLRLSLTRHYAPTVARMATRNIYGAAINISDAAKIKEMLINISEVLSWLYCIYVNHNSCDVCDTFDIARNVANRSRSKGAFIVFLINHVDAQHVMNGHSTLK